MARRCRLCTSNNRDELIEQLAERMWQVSHDPTIDPPWERAGEYWQKAMRGYARVFADTCMHEPV